MRPKDVAAALANPVLRTGGAYMRDPATSATGRSLGFSPSTFYYVGRLGVLGDVDGDVAMAAAYFLPPEHGRDEWEKGLKVMPAREAATRYAECAHRWGRRHLDGAIGLSRLAALAERVVWSVEPAGLPLFAGWRAMPLPDDDAGRAAALLHVLREHRGGVHGIAVVACGMTPLEAIVSDPRYEDVHRSGWPQPYPDPASLRERRAAAESLTTELAASAYEVLTHDERAELVDLVWSAQAAAFPPD
jgi:hypothetical protein